MSGRSHRVLTGVQVIAPDGRRAGRIAEAKVRFKRLSAQEIDGYLESDEWRGKAGGYGVQGRAGAFVISIQGSYTAVVGLPLLFGAVAHWPLLLTAFLPFVGFGMLIPAIDEEPGWRGFALPRLQQRYGPLWASVILGTLHGLWHIPALFTALYGPLPLANLLPFILTAALATVLYTWVYNHTGGSILIAMLMHAASNAATPWLTALLKVTGLAAPETGLVGYLVGHGWLNVIAFGLAAALVVVLTRGRLGYRPTTNAPRIPEVS
jgi:membrane protease YdiL (CAAX protease family)